MIAGQVFQRPFDALIGLQRRELPVAVFERDCARGFLVVSLRIELRLDRLQGRARKLRYGGILQCGVHRGLPELSAREEGPDLSAVGFCEGI